MTIKITLATFLLILAFHHVAPRSEVPFDPAQWEIDAKESKFTDHLGRKSLMLRGGVATLKGADFTDGVIEFDMAFSETRGFMGVIWRSQGGGNYEEFYIRPHQSGNPDANQYTPVFNGLAGWQLYHGEGYGAPVKYKFNEWIPIKIVVSGSQAEIYINDMEKAALFVPELKRQVKSGRIGFSVGDFAPAYYSNFRYSAVAGPALKNRPKSPEPAPAGTIMSWMVSNTIAEKSLATELAAKDKSQLTWKRLDCESTGLANLARIQGITQDRNTAFARLTIVSTRDQVKKIRFGFSDRVRAYLNDRLLYAGMDNYLSRDYRFLGTIGYFDELYLPLRKGENELWLAVSEDFGGWGVKARFDDLDGIEIR